MTESLRILILSVLTSVTAFSQRQQVVAPNLVDIISPINSPVSITVNYSTLNPENDLTNGLGLQMHYDSTKLNFIDLSNVSANDLVQLDDTQVDADNDDNDTDTDKFVLIAWINDDNSWSGVSELFTAEFQTLFASNETTNINFTASSRAVAWDPDTQTGSRYEFSSQSVRIAEGNLTQTIHLKAGWNQIGFNIRPDDTTVNGILGDAISANIVKGIVGQGKQFNAAAGGVSDPPNNLAAFVDGFGYWINMSDGTTLELTGDLANPATQIQLSAGWNHVGFIFQKEVAIDTALLDLLNTNNLLKVIGDGKNFDPLLPDNLNTLKMLKPGNGYWIKVKIADILIFRQ